EAKLHAAQKLGLLDKAARPEIIHAALRAGIIDKREAELLALAEQAGSAAIRVDDFAPEQLTTGIRPS
ncbi:acyl-CoA dehydrogenase domain-containing protein, partial [Methylomonas rivi]